jgi:hypothetical protein
LLLISRDSNALLSEEGVSRCQERIFRNLRALGKEGTNHDCPRYAKAFSTKVSFYHGALHGDECAITAVTAERELRYGPFVAEVDVRVIIRGVVGGVAEEVVPGVLPRE